MKKSILAAVLMAVVTMTASAVNIDWISNALSFEGSALKTVKSGVSAQLLFLNGNSLSTYTIDEAFTASLIGNEVSAVGETTKAAKTSGTLTYDYGTYGNGDSFALLISYVSDGEKYWNLSSVVNTLSGIEDETSDPSFSVFTFNNERGTDPTLTAGGGWVKAVPEPATGALALAGLALLFRRKRA